MMKKHRNKFNNDQRGMTLVEVLVSLAIISIILMSFVPLQIYLSKISAMNRAKLGAQLQATMILEELTAQVNKTISATKKGFDSDDFKIGVEESSKVIDGITYKIVRAITWVDDPEDGTYPADILPFDYKKIEITVTATGSFGKPITKKYATILARQGDAIPYTGVVVEVQRAYENSSGHDKPLAGVTVTLNPISASSASATGITNENGKAVISVDIPDSWPDSELFTYQINLQMGDYMMNPDQVDITDPNPANWVKVKRWHVENSNIMQFEPAAHFRFTMNSIHAGGVIKIFAPEGTISESIPAGVTRTRSDGPIETTQFWPLSTYPTEALFQVWQEPFDTASFSIWDSPMVSGDPPSKKENLWQYQSGYWDADTGNNQPNDGYHPEGKNRLVSPIINLLPYKGGLQLPLESLIMTWEQTLVNGSASPDFYYAYVGKDSPLPDASSGWDGLSKIGDYVMPLHTKSLTPSYATSGFRLRFDSCTDIISESVDNLKMEARYYNGSIKFVPGETKVINIHP